VEHQEEPENAGSGIDSPFHKPSSIHLDYPLDILLRREKNGSGDTTSCKKVFKKGI
jgi:hypothetical protein